MQRGKGVGRLERWASFGTLSHDPGPGIPPLADGHVRGARCLKQDAVVSSDWPCFPFSSSQLHPAVSSPCHIIRLYDSRTRKLHDLSFVTPPRNPSTLFGPDVLPSSWTHSSNPSQMLQVAQSTRSRYAFSAILIFAHQSHVRTPVDYLPTGFLPSRQPIHPHPGIPP